MKTARAKGLNNNVRLYKHALQNALIPVVTVAGIQLAVIIGGVVTVEIVFGIKGMGRVVVQAILNRDYPVAQVAIMVLAIGFVYINLIVDITYTFIDPRIKYGDEHE
jgi:peptide/nickel transport system permease protein